MERSHITGDLCIDVSRNSTLFIALVVAFADDYFTVAVACPTALSIVPRTKWKHRIYNVCVLSQLILIDTPDDLVVFA